MPDADRQRAGSGSDGGHGRLTGTARRAAERYTRARARLDRTAAGRVQRRITEIDLVHQALILAALALMLIIPLLVSIAALLPLGSQQGTIPVLAHRAGLSDEATRDLQQLFPSRDRVRGDTTWLSVLVSLASAFAWPAALQKGYELAWRLPSLGPRGMWRPLVWLISFVALVGIVAAMTTLVSGWVSAVLVAALLLPVIFAWAWWSQYLLLGGRVAWHALLPGGIAIAIGLVGMRVFADAFLSESITTHYQRYGPLGVVFMLLSWFIAFSFVILGGAVLGAELHDRRVHKHRARRART